MQTHHSPFPLRRAIALALVLTACAALPGCKPAHHVDLATAEADKPVPAIVHTREDAFAVLMALPELKAWTALIEKNSGGKSHGTVIGYGATPKIIDGKYYFQMSYVENGPDNMSRWEDFLVQQDGAIILVEDDATDKVRTLEQWRAAKRPMLRKH